MVKASDDSLGDLHGALADALRERLKGEPTAADLNVIRQFLKDNNVTSAGEAGSPLGNLMNELTQSGALSDLMN